MSSDYYCFADTRGRSVQGPIGSYVAKARIKDPVLGLGFSHNLPSAYLILVFMTRTVFDGKKAHRGATPYQNSSRMILVASTIRCGFSANTMKSLRVEHTIR